MPAALLKTCVLCDDVISFEAGSLEEVTFIAY